MNQTRENHLIIFCKNPILGQCKTRLAARIGPEKALAVYKFLLEHTAKITAEVPAKRVVFYSNYLEPQDAFDPKVFDKDVQQGDDLGARMVNAINTALTNGAKKAIVIGSDLYDLTPELIVQAFDRLDTHKTVIGPARDGGYYLIGMTHMNPDLFENKIWGSATVLTDTLINLKPDSPFLLPIKNDIDQFEDLYPEEVFNPLIK